MYTSLPPHQGPLPPNRPYSAYNPTSNDSTQPPPPPRPSSAYVAPFPGQSQSYNESPEPTYNPPYPLQPPNQTLPQRYSSLTSTTAPTPGLYQPQPVSVISPQEIFPQRNTSLRQIEQTGNDNNEGDYHDNNAGFDNYHHNNRQSSLPAPSENAYQNLYPLEHSNESVGITFEPGAQTFQPQLLDHTPSITSGFSSLSFDNSSSNTTISEMQHQIFPSSSSSSISSSSTATEPPRVISFPTIESLQQRALDLDKAEDIEQILWAQDVLRLVEKQLALLSGNSGAIGGGGGESPIDFTHPDLNTDILPNIISKLPLELKDLLENSALPIIIVLSESNVTNQNQNNKKAFSLALYLKAKLLSTGICSNILPKNQRQAFKDFESSARNGEIRGWFKLGRDYEGVNDFQRAKDCYERGLKRNDCECTYRMGMAHLLGQLNLQPNPTIALSLLKQASELSTIDFPQPSYVYGMLLAGELSVPTPIPSNLVIIPSSSSNNGSIQNEGLYNQWNIAKESIEKSAYLGCSSAQYKLGFLFEHANLNCQYDPLLSVNWYTFASKNGEKEADMALSKWFLCGAEGNFPKNEHLAKTFAEKAARKNHPNGCFALGYYYEIGVGGRKDLDQARKWYQKAANLGNTDAPLRLSALSSPVPTSISMAEHESRLNDTLVRRRTQAKIRSDRQSISRPTRRQQQVQQQQHDGNQPIIQMPQAQVQAFTSPRPNSTQDWDQRQQQQPPMRMPIPNHTASPSPMSPSIKVGEIMSPNPNYNYGNNGNIGIYNQNRFSTSNSFPSRPPIPHQSFNQNQISSQPYENSTYPGNSNNNINNNRRQQQEGYAYNNNNENFNGGRRPSGISTSTSLSDLPLPVEDNSKKPKKEAQTFAEMGFVSKPVEEDGCLIM
ncbi:uncharacterized protein L201_000120 [Kwoniella dendrophila CBS 6074]|uniref:Uncharacterized protein n=1 Tax=Kwoniella dendrophila CBS 6074 TaxID=1295534 RepID=A0AAX4JLF8_9TREE